MPLPSPPSLPLAAQEPYCITQARAVQTKGGACDSGNTNYRGDTDSTINLGCPALVKKIKGTPGYRPPSDACCSELIAWTEAGCACNADLKAQAIKENTKDLRVFAAMAKSAQILCAQKQASINDPCGAPCNGAAAAA